MKILLFSVLSFTLFFNPSFAQTKQQPMNNKNNSIEIIRYTIEKTKQPEFESAYAEAAKLLQASRYCLGYQILHGDDDPDNYIVVIK